MCCFLYSNMTETDYATDEIISSIDDSKLVAENIMESLLDKNKISYGGGIEYEEFRQLIYNEIYNLVVSNKNVVVSKDTDVNGDNIKEEDVVVASDILNEQYYGLIANMLTDQVEKQIAKDVIVDSQTSGAQDKNMYYSTSLKLRIRSFSEKSGFID
jgi:hypothetical protein